MRINKFLTEQGYCSRREADRLIEAGRVQINERQAVLGDQVQENDLISVDGKPVAAGPKWIYIMYNKPKGITCTTDPQDFTNIIDAVRHPLRVFPIGRLDKESTGLIFLTNDGNVVNRILRAQFGHEKEYEVEVDHPIDDAFLKKMSLGVDIDDHVTLVSKTHRLGKNSFTIVLTEGKNRQIRRMCDTLGYHVRRLHRVRIMNVRLGPLPAGKWVDVPASELKTLFKMLDSGEMQIPKAEISPDQFETEE